MNEMDLDRLLSEARANPALPSAERMARIMRDAAAEQPRVAVAEPPQPIRRARSATARPGFWARLIAGFGGAGVVAGLGAVALTGTWLGYADPGGLTESFLTYADAGLEMVPVDELFLIEG